jgi:hypothetical protein
MTWKKDAKINKGNRSRAKETRKINNVQATQIEERNSLK